MKRIDDDRYELSYKDLRAISELLENSELERQHAYNWDKKIVDKYYTDLDYWCNKIEKTMLQFGENEE